MSKIKLEISTIYIFLIYLHLVITISKEYMWSKTSLLFSFLGYDTIWQRFSALLQKAMPGHTHSDWYTVSSSCMGAIQEVWQFSLISKGKLHASWKWEFSVVFDWQRTGPVPFQLLHKNILSYQTRTISEEVNIFELEKADETEKREPKSAAKYCLWRKIIFFSSA